MNNREIFTIYKANTKTTEQIRLECKEQGRQRFLKTMLYDGLNLVLQKRTNLSRYEQLNLLDYFLNGQTLTDLINGFENVYFGSFLQQFHDFVEKDYPRLNSDILYQIKSLVDPLNYPIKKGDNNNE